MAIPSAGLTKRRSATSTPAEPLYNDRELNISLLFNFKSHLHKSGKICPKPWFWGRFFIEYQPGYESYWLVQWWQTNDEQKRVRFLQQLEYLARETGHFREAYSFLCAIEDRDWHYSPVESL